MSPALMTEPHILRLQRFVERTRGLTFDDYDAMWRWSVGDLDAFWGTVWQYFAIESPTPYDAVLADDRMPGARWFPGASVNYAQQALRHADAAHAAGHPAIVFRDEAMGDALQALSWPELRQRVASLAASLRAFGVQRGDRVCAWLPNRPETVVAFLACASIGAVWSLCSPDMGPVAVLDRFRQIEPKVLFVCDGYRYGGVAHDRHEVARTIIDGLPTIEHVVVQPLLGAAEDATALTTRGTPMHLLQDLLRDDHPTPFAPEWLPFDHPLWIVYSSGTTGLPKAIVHGHGGAMLEGLKLQTFHNDIGSSLDGGDRFHWYSSTGWIMWNSQVGGLLGGTTIALYDGNPGWPDAHTLWRFVADAGVTFFGAGAAFYAGCMKAGIEPNAAGDLSALRALGSTGSPLAAEAWGWADEHVRRGIRLTSMSGGTDFAGAFVGGLPTAPIVPGEMQCRCLGAAVHAWSEDGRELIDEVGELVCTRPMPSMPLYLWGDADGSRLRDSYFDVYPGVWRHGDWVRITPRGSAIIYGRSDATINRYGIRMGTAELYRAVEALPDVQDSLVVDLEMLGRESWMGLFVVLRDGALLDAALVARIKSVVREALSPRHVPNEVLAVPAIPRTLSGKKMELPVKKLLLGAEPAKVMNRDAMANADSVEWFVAFARDKSGALSRTAGEGRG